ncbi:MAG: hypothetical protein MJE77_42710 [Proteobacteria bacterium]|nr:hypothetical protein [Pseudomonadota bacterium]
MKEGDIGLAGIGRSGEWTVELDENAEEELAVSITHPRICLQLPPMSEAQVYRLRQSIESTESGEFGRMFGALLSLEFAARGVCFRLRDGSVLLELSISLTEFSGLADAFRAACIDADLVDAHF